MVAFNDSISEGVAELILSKFNMPYKISVVLINVKTSNFQDFCNTLLKYHYIAGKFI